jgi:hypothetical protein
MNRWQRREKAQRKARYGMRISGRSLKSVIAPLIVRKVEAARAGKAIR